MFFFGNLFETMENSNDSPLVWENDDPDDQKEKWIVKHHIMVLIDVSLPTSSTYDSKSFFSLSIDVCKNLAIHLIKKNRNDKIGIMLFGTNDENKTCPKYIKVLNEPKKPNIDMIKMLDNLTKSEFSSNATLLTTPIADALWYSSYLMKKCTANQSCSTIVLISCNDQPKFSNSMKQFNLRKRLEDVIKNEIDFKFIPIGEAFNMGVFYENFLSSFNSIAKPTGGLENTKDIMLEINEKIKYGRSVSKIKFFIDNDNYITTALYNFYSKSRIPAKIRLDKKSNKQLTSIHQVFTLKSNELLFKSDLGKYIIIAQQKILFKNEDILVLNSSIIEPGIRLLGFTDKNNIFISYHYKASTFIRPADIDSTLLFNSLLECCLEMNKSIMCFIKVRNGARVHLAAMIPQDEIVDGNGSQQRPAGFHCVYVPFLECSRKISPQQHDSEEITDQQVELAKSICEKMYIDYCPSLIKNPKLNCHWAMLEAMALELEAPTILDETLPQNNVIDNNLSILKDDIVSKLFQKLSATVSKKRSASSYNNKKKVKKTK